ncbi:MAG: hypothetical protein M1570_09220 [Chloroflexi bacterium]|nr:hypothetical protein [Chloroflexota bacterium]
MSTQARLDQFARNLRPDQGYLDEAQRQTDYMIEQLQNRASADCTFTLEKILKAGSNAKGTSLRPTEEHAYDVDLGAYYSGKGISKDRLDALLSFTQDQLYDIYKVTKTREDFEILKSAVRVHFRSGIELEVDVTPIIRDDSLRIENGGWIPRSDEWRLTSVTCHIEFIQRRTDKSNKIPGPVKFNLLIRMFKWWNNLQGDLQQPSFLCDLIVAAAFENTPVTGEWSSSLRQVFSFLRKHQFRDPIIFDDYYRRQQVKLPTAAVIVLDPVNAENNVTHSWTEDTRTRFLERVEDAYDAIMMASSCAQDGDEEAEIGEWCRVFGPDFEILSEPDEED